MALLLLISIHLIKYSPLHWQIVNRIAAFYKYIGHRLTDIRVYSSLIRTYKIWFYSCKMNFRITSKFVSIYHPRLTASDSFSFLILSRCAPFLSCITIRLHIQLHRFIQKKWPITIMHSICWYPNLTNRVFSLDALINSTGINSRITRPNRKSVYWLATWLDDR